MNRKHLYGILIATTLACTLGGILTGTGGGLAADAVLSFPFSQLGNWLRTLSLGSPTGNGLAIALYALFCSLPAIYLILRLARRRIQAEDTLLVVMSALLFFLMHRMINPSLLNGLFPQLADGTNITARTAFSVTFDSILASYLVARIFRRIKTGGSADILKPLKALLVILAAVFIYSICGAGLGDLILATSADLYLDYRAIVLEIILFVLGQAPTALVIVALLKAIRLLDALAADRFGEAAATSAAVLARLSAAAVLAIMAGTILKNVLQLLFGAMLTNINILAALPLADVLVVLALYYLARYFAASHQLQRENDSFI